MRPTTRWLLIVAALTSLPSIASGQEPTDPIPPQLRAPFDAIIQDMRFEQPTRITARLMTMDPYENAIWIEWISRYNGTNWVAVPDHRQFKVLPRNADMMDYFKSLKPGSSLKMTVQADENGNRRILELDDAS